MCVGVPREPQHTQRTFSYPTRQWRSLPIDCLKARDVRRLYNPFYTNYIHISHNRATNPNQHSRTTQNNALAIRLHSTQQTSWFRCIVVVNMLQVEMSHLAAYFEHLFRLCDCCEMAAVAAVTHPTTYPGSALISTRLSWGKSALLGSTFSDSWLNPCLVSIELKIYLLTNGNASNLFEDKCREFIEVPGPELKIIYMLVCIRESWRRLQWTMKYWSLNIIIVSNVCLKLAFFSVVEFSEKSEREIVLTLRQVITEFSHEDQCSKHEFVVSKNKDFETWTTSKKLSAPLARSALWEALS